jgi:hypothetical protein
LYVHACIHLKWCLNTLFHLFLYFPYFFIHLSSLQDLISLYRSDFIWANNEPSVLTISCKFILFNFVRLSRPCSSILLTTVFLSSLKHQHLC